MQIDKAPFPVHTLEQAKGAKGKNVVIGDPRPMNVNDKILARKVVKEKTADGERTLKITIRAPRLEGHGSSPSGSRVATQAQSADRLLKPVPPAGQTSPVTVPGLSSRSIRKWVLGRPTRQRCREGLLFRSLPLISC